MPHRLTEANVARVTESGSVRMSEFDSLSSGVVSSGGAASNFVLREDGSDVLREDGSRVLRET
jgi:hypothetical protein